MIGGFYLDDGQQWGKTVFNESKGSLNEGAGHYLGASTGSSQPNVLPQAMHINNSF
jgi:hypothetical protein